MTSDLLEIHSKRLRLVAVDLGLAVLQLDDPEAFFEALGVARPAVWPPELMDRAALKWAQAKLESEPASHGWLFWVFMVRGADGQPDEACGSGGFKGPPDDNGTVEIGYSILSEFRSKGIASEASQALIDWAVQTGGIKRVIGHTLPDLAASRRVMEKVGMKEEACFFNEEDQLEVVRYGLNLR